MKARGEIVVAQAVGPSQRSTLQSARSEPPFSIRECGGRVLVAASAAAPLGGDELLLDIDVLANAHADIGTVASTIVQPGPTGAPSTMLTRCRVGAAAHFDWVGEPTVSVAGSDHTITTVVDLAGDATCRVVEEVSLGRSGEPSGRLRLVLRVERAGQPLLHHDEVFGPEVPGAGSVVSNGSGRHVLSEVLVGVDAGEPRVSMADECRTAWLPLGHDAAMILAVGADRPSVSAAVAAIRS